MVFTENNQSKGIMVQLVTPGTNDRRPLFPSSLSQVSTDCFGFKINYFFD